MGLMVLVGRLTLNFQYVAFAVFIDNCGSLRSYSLIAVPNSYSTIFKAVTSLPSQHIQLIGTCITNGHSSAFLSEYDRAGGHVSTVSFRFSLQIEILDGLAVRGGSDKLMVGYSGEGLNYYDALIVFSSSSGGVTWAYRFDSFGQDEFRAVCECSFGYVLVGVCNAGQAGLVMIMDNQKNVIQQKAIPGANLLEVKCTRGGFAAVGDMYADEKTNGLFVTGDITGVQRIIQFERLSSTTELTAKGFEQLFGSRFAVVFDIVDVSFRYNRLVAIEIDLQRSEILVKAREVTAGVKNEQWRTEAFFSSPQGGFNIAGQGQVTGIRRSFYIAEMTIGLGFPGFQQYAAIPLSEFHATVVSSAVDITMARYVMDGFVKTNVAVQESFIDIAEERNEFGDSCTVLPTTQAPSFGPTTTYPSVRPTATPSRTPSRNPSARPTSACPTLRPVTTTPTAVGETNPPSPFPSLKPSADPTVKPTWNPTWNPTADPSHAPSRRPSAPPTSKPTRLPSQMPSFSTSENPSINPTTTPAAAPTVSPTNPAEDLSSNGTIWGAVWVIVLIFIGGGCCLICTHYCCTACKKRITVASQASEQTDIETGRGEKDKTESVKSVVRTTNNIEAKKKSRRHRRVKPDDGNCGSPSETPTTVRSSASVMPSRGNHDDDEEPLPESLLERIRVLESVEDTPSQYNFNNYGESSLSECGERESKRGAVGVEHMKGGCVTQCDTD